MNAIEQMIERTIGVEGGYSNHPADRGGPTRWGITERVARKHGYSGDMRSLPRATAVQIYRAEYLIGPGFADVAALSEKVAAELFDTGVNMGPDIPKRWFQEWLNAFNNGGTDYPDILEDGLIGPATLNAFAALIRKRGKDLAELIMLRGLNADQGVRYKQLMRARAANEAFGVGWIRQRVGL